MVTGYILWADGGKTPIEAETVSAILAKAWSMSGRSVRVHLERGMVERFILLPGEGKGPGGWVALGDLRAKATA